MNARIWFAGLLILGSTGCGEPNAVVTTSGATSGSSSGSICVPTVEICGNGIDEDCSGSDCDAQTSWAKRFGEENRYQQVSGVAQMPDGSVLFVGQVHQNIDFGNGNSLPSIPPFNHPFLAKLNADGTFAWARDAGDGFDGMADGEMTDVLVVQGSNDIITTGHVGDYWGAAMVWRWDAGGNPVSGWGKSLFAQSDHYHHRASHLALSPEGTTLYVSGIVRFAGTFACATPLSFDAGGAVYPFVAAIDMSTGSCEWARVYEGDNTNTSNIPIAVTPSGGITVASLYRGPAPKGAKLPDDAQPGEGLDRAYLMRLDPANGDILHAVAFPPPFIGTFMGDVFPNLWINEIISVDDAVYVAGRFYGTISLDDPVYPFSLSTDLGDNGNGVVMELDPKVLGVRWAERIRGTRYSPDAMSLIALGDDLIVAGKMASSDSVQPAIHSTLCKGGSSSFCLFLLRMSRTDHTRRWFREWTMVREYAWSGSFQIAGGPAGLAAEIVPPIDMGTGLLDAKGETDIVVAKLPTLP